MGGIAARHHLKVLEDCAHAHGGKWKGQGLGSLGDAGSFSFQTSKLMTAGEGGIVLTNDPSTMDALFALTNCGRQRPERQEDVLLVGHNYRMTDLQAAILEVQLSRLELQHQVRNTNMAHLDRELPKIDGLEPLRKDPRITTRAAYQYVFRYDPQAFGGVKRDAFVAALVAEGVPSDGHFYQPLHQSELLQVDSGRYPAWAARRQKPDCPVSRRAAYEEAVWLPHFLFLGTRQDTDEIMEAIHKVCDHVEELQELEHPSIQDQTLSRARRGERDR